MDQNDLFHNAPPSWAFTNKQKLNLFTTFLWICRVQTKRQPTKTKDCTKLKSKSTRFCKQLHVRHTKATGRCGHKKEFECSSLLENPKSWAALFSFLGWGLFRWLFSVPSYCNWLMKPWLTFWNDKNLLNLPVIVATFTDSARVVCEPHAWRIAFPYS
jgi:hypothetical protein